MQTTSTSRALTKTAALLLPVICLPLVTLTVSADTSWISTSSSVFTTTGNWSNGLPSTGPQLGIFPDAELVQHTIDITGTTARNSLGLQFTNYTGVGSAGFVFGSSTNNSPGFQNRATNIAGTGASILNDDDNTQTFNVPVKMFSSTAGSGALAAQTFLARNGGFVFSGIFNGNTTPARATIDNNGGLLTIDGAFNTTVGIAGAAYGDIVGAGGLTKNGAGTLTLGGTLPNIYTGPTTLNGGLTVLNKPNALGTTASALTIAAGATLDISTNAQAVGAVTVAGGTLDGSAILTGSSFSLESGTINLSLGGVGGLTKVTAGLALLNGASSYSGPTQVDAGILRLGGNDRINNASPFVMNGGTFSLNGFSETVGTLDLNSGSIFDFGSGLSSLTFSDSDSMDWGGSILTIINWTAGSDTFRIGTDGAGFETQLALIQFADLGNAPAQIDSNGFITPVPEPSAVIISLLGGFGLLINRRRRRS